jgi:hypothetical protein
VVGPCLGEVGEDELECRLAIGDSA